MSTLTTILSNRRFPLYLTIGLAVLGVLQLYNAQSPTTSRYSNAPGTVTTGTTTTKPTVEVPPVVVTQPKLLPSSAAKTLATTQARDQAAPASVQASREGGSADAGTTPAGMVSLKPQLGRAEYVPAKRGTVLGPSVTMRKTPDVDGTPMVQLRPGTEIAFMNQSAGDWTEVMTNDGAIGWITQAAVLDGTPAENADNDTAAIVQSIITMSVSSYAGICPCPYSRDASGASCGARSAYTRDSAYALVCFAVDIPQNQINALKQQIR